MPTRRATLAAFAGLAALPARAAAPRPVVIELFTSQGCSSCPPADSLLRELSGHAEVLPLAFHVTYWNNLGWKDPFSLDLATARQRAYAARLGLDGIYTPQAVVDGRIDVVGSDRPGVARALRQAAASQAAGPPITLTAASEQLSVALGAGEGAGRVLLVGYDREHQTRVGRGENAGATLTEANIVRGFAEIGTWHGAPLTLAAARPAGERLAVLVQAADGRYLAVG